MSKPQIRFKGFEDEWELHTFCDIATRHSSMKYDENIPSVEYEDINSKKGTLNKDISRKAIHKVGQHFVSGDILFGKLRPYLGNNLLADFEGVAVGDFWILKQGLVNTRFLYPFLYSNEFSYISNISSGSKMPRSDWGLVSSWNFAIPMSESEQSLIGELFNNIDKAIAEAEREVSRLEKMKQASLQKMFPRPGASAPEIRFDGFTEPWNVMKLGDILTVNRGGSPRPIESFLTSSENGLNWVKIGDVEKGARYITHTAEKIKPEGLSHTRQVYPGDLVLSNSMSFGRPYIMKINGCIHDGWLLIRDDNKIFDTEFLQQLLGSDNMIRQYKALAAGGVVNNLNSDLVQSSNLIFPSINEQKAIGEYFRNLDSLLSAKRQKLVKLHNIKQACLDKMFVNSFDL